MARQRSPRDVEFLVLARSRRRCAFCFALNGDRSIKEGQIAHIDHNPQNASPENLVFLCLVHHNAYDSKTSQSKGLTAHELQRYRADLDRFVESSLARERPLGGVPVSLQEEALEFSTSPHRSQSVVLLLKEGPRSLGAINRHIPPCDLEFTHSIVADVAEHGWVQETESGRYALSDRARAMLNALAAIPDSVLEDAWRDVWG